MKAHSISWALAAQRFAPEWCHWEFQAEAHSPLIKRHFFNSIHMVCLHFSSYSITLLQIQTLPSFPFLSQSKRKLTTENRGPVPTGPHWSTYLQLYQMLPTDVVPEYQAKKKHGLSNCKEKEKRQSRRKESKRNESDSFLETWSQVWQTVLCLHDIMHRYSLSAFAGCWATEICAKKRKIKWKLSLRPVWKQLEQADVIVWYNSILNEM